MYYVIVIFPSLIVRTEYKTGLAAFPNNLASAYPAAIFILCGKTDVRLEIYFLVPVCTAVRSQPFSNVFFAI
jgi:hypothetical protein